MASCVSLSIIRPHSDFRHYTATTPKPVPLTEEQCEQMHEAAIDDRYPRRSTVINTDTKQMIISFTGDLFADGTYIVVVTTFSKCKYAIKREIGSLNVHRLCQPTTMKFAKRCPPAPRKKINPGRFAHAKPIPMQSL